MNRNTESHFSLLPHADISRSRFDRSASVKTTFNVGDIIPFFVEEVLPGDTFDVKTSKVVRLQTLLTPVMDNLYLDTYYFFVPNRLVWDHWKEFCGENTESAWIPATEYSIPQLISPDAKDAQTQKRGWKVGTIADYMGIPTGVGYLAVNALPFRAYALIMNEWFRDQNLQDPLVVPTDDAQVTGVNTGTFVTDVAKGGLPYKASKYHDYFTSCLPSPQKGPDVTVPLAQSGFLPVVPRGEAIPASMLPPAIADGTTYTLSGYYVGDSGQKNSGFAGVASATPDESDGSVAWRLDKSKYLTTMNPDMVSGGGFSPTNLWAYTDGNAVAATINQLRLAFQIQKFYEQQARGGSRYTEVVRSFFGVTSPDARLQRPEYLGGNRVPITINQVIQQAGVASVETGRIISPLGDVAGQSLTTDSHSDFLKSFTEHGYVIGVMVARYDHTYQQGLNRMWSRKDKFDFYWPVFANIGEQAVKNKEIYAQGAGVMNSAGGSVDNEVFGYQEAWAEYRYKPSIVTGEMRSSYAQTLDAWHFADYYSQLPTLSESWIQEDKSNVDRALAVSSNLSNQLFCDIYVRNYVTRPMPMYSIPGLIDHH